MVRKTGIGRCAGNNDCGELIQMFSYNISFLLLLLFLGFRVADDGGAEGTGLDRGGT